MPRESDWSYPPDKPFGIVPLFGSDPGWSPQKEQVPYRSPKCPTCGGQSGPIRRNSKLYCCACHRSGLDHRFPPHPVVSVAQQAANVEIRLTAKQIAYLSRSYGEEAASWLRGLGYDVAVLPNPEEN